MSTPAGPRTTISFDTWTSVIVDDETDGIYASSDAPSRVDVDMSKLKEEFWSEYAKFLKQDNFASLFSLANQYKKCLKGEICFDPILGRALPHAKLSSDFDRIRRIAQIGELFQPVANSFPRMVQAYCYLATGHKASAYHIVKSMNEPLKALKVASKAVRAKQPVISKQLNDLREFFKTTDYCSTAEPEYPHHLKI